jgi:hypothetical protein
MNSDKLRNWLTACVADLRAKRVLPVIVLLLAAAIAIPLLLSHSGKAASLAPLPAAPVLTTPTPTATATAVSERRHEPKQNYLTGPSHNPFITSTTASASTATTASTTTTSSTAGTASAGTSTAAAPASASSASSGTGASSGTSTSSGTGGSSKSGTRSATAAGGSSSARTVTVVTPTHTTTVARTTTVPATPLPYSTNQVAVTLLQAGVSSAPTPFHNLSRDQLLPSADNAFATYLGVRTDKRTAVFVLAAGSTVTGVGQCAPSASACTFLTLTPGQSARIATPSGATFTLSYAKLYTVSSSASVVAVDPAGAADVKSAERYIGALKTVRYGRYTGLLRIKLGTTVPVTR